MPTHGSLVVVGTGIKAISHVTAETEDFVRCADKVFYLVADSVTEHWLLKINPTAESLYGYYAPDKDRDRTYEEIISTLMDAVAAGQSVCCALYGHPSVFAYPGREAVRRLRANGHAARLMPGISAEACLFADLGLDPGVSGCQSYEATDFLIRRRIFDPNALLVLWQVALIGVTTTPTESANRGGLIVLRDYLLEHYPPEHGVIIFEAAQFSMCDPAVCTVALRDLPQADMSPICTLVVPARGETACDRNMLEQLNIPHVRPRHAR